jgi:hypothetical protein
MPAEESPGVGDGADRGSTGPSATHPTANAEIYAALKKLARGRGLNAPEIQLRIGPVLARAVSGGAAGDRAAVDRAAVVRWLDEGLRALPEDLRITAQVVFGLHPQVQHRFLGERLDWLGEQWGRDRRTIRRRVDEALRLLVERHGADVGGEAPRRTESATWYTECLSALVRLDRAQPAVTEERTIIATADGVEAVTVERSLPPPGAGGQGGWSRDLSVEMLYGGILRGRDRPSESHFRFHIELPVRLRTGERHKFGIALEMPAGQPMAPHYVCLPLTRCAEFQIRVRFSPRQVAAGTEVFVLDGVPPRAVDDDPSRLPRLDIDRAGEAQLRFVELQQGRGYGLRWTTAGGPG